MSLPVLVHVLIIRTRRLEKCSKTQRSSPQTSRMASARELRTVAEIPPAFTPTVSYAPHAHSRLPHHSSHANLSDRSSLLHLLCPNIITTAIAVTHEVDLLSKQLAALSYATLLSSLASKISQVAIKPPRTSQTWWKGVVLRSTSSSVKPPYQSPLSDLTPVLFFVCLIVSLIMNRVARPSGRSRSTGWSDTEHSLIESTY